MDLNEIFESALSGNVSKNIIIKAIGKLLGKELTESLKMIVSINNNYYTFNTKKHMRKFRK